LNPSVLSDAGFRVAALEVPVGLGADRVVIDVVLVHDASGLILAVEAKSGSNVDEAQALKYSRLDAQALVHAASIDLTAGVRPSVSVVFACQADNAARIQMGLSSAKLHFGILAVHPENLTLVNRQFMPGAFAQAFPNGPLLLPYGIPRLIPCDHESPIDIIRKQVKPVLVAHLSQRTTQVSAEVIAEETLTSLPLYGKGARGRFVRSVIECLRQISAEDPEIFEFRGRTANHDALIRFLKTPEDNDPRGRTQAYQALARGAQPRRRVREQHPDQLDLLSALGLGENVAGADNTDEVESSLGGDMSDEANDGGEER
jgi:hypothetical protein